MKDRISRQETEPRQRIALDGKWERWLGGSLLDHVHVPSSCRPVGTTVLRRTFRIPPPLDGRRAVLRFEGITYNAQVTINGSSVGRMGPYSPYEFDITSFLKPDYNDIAVEITDWQVPLGPSDAWEAYGGIIRDVFIEIRNSVYIENAHLLYDLAEDCSRSHCSLTVFISGCTGEPAHATAELLDGSQCIASSGEDVSLDADSNEVTLTFDVENPELWSPGNPRLYELKASLKTGEGSDTFRTRTGFRDLKIEPNRFLLNGEPLVLSGVCRHDMYPGHGYTLTTEQIETDMRMIKEMGANFVRLVHYPHDRRVIDAAERIGLLVTEEPGICWTNFGKVDKVIPDTAIDMLERIVRRDWNSPALFGMLLANESTPSKEYAMTAAERIRGLCPRLLVSIAQVYFEGKGHEVEKEFFDEAGLDFYTRHPYTHEMMHFLDVGRIFSGKPFVFTEWGGRTIRQSPLIADATIAEIGKLIAQGRLSGHCFWSWADWPEFSRRDLEMKDGIGLSGVVTEQREIRPELHDRLKRLFAYTPSKQEIEPGHIEILESGTKPLSPQNSFAPIDLQQVAETQEQSSAWEELNGILSEYWPKVGLASKHWFETGRRFWLWKKSRLSIDSMPFHLPTIDGEVKPLLVTPAIPRVSIPVDTRAARIHVMGNVTIPEGYPIIGKVGQQVASYRIISSDGTVQSVPLRWGMEIARGNMIARASRIDPTATRSHRAIVYTKHRDREVYQARILSLDTGIDHVSSIECSLAETPSGPDNAEGTGRIALAIFGVTIEA